MVRFVMLINFTDRGIAEAKGSPARAEEFRQTCVRLGATVESQLWTLGAYDGIAILTAPDESAAAAIGLEISRKGFVRTTMLRAFDAAEFKAVLGKLS